MTAWCHLPTPLNPKRLALLFTLLSLAGTWAEQRVVDPLHGPYRTISEAVKNLEAGDEVIIHAGTYRETVKVQGLGTANSPIVIRAAESDEGKVIIKGSDVLTGWTYDRKLANGARVYTRMVDYSLEKSDFGKFKTDDPLDERADMVFVNGRHLTQVDSPEKLAAYTFYVPDGNAERLMQIALPGNLNIDKATVEVAVRQKGLFIEWRDYTKRLGSGYIHFKGLTVMHVATVRGAAYAKAHGGAILIRNGSHYRFENCRTEWNNWSGVLVGGGHHEFINHVTANNGNAGMDGGTSNSVFRHCIFARNGWRFGPGFTGGGIKWCGNFDGTHDNTYLDCQFRDNRGPGLWYDTVGAGSLIDRCVFAGNRYHGIVFEAISPTYGGFTVRNCLFYGQEGRDSGKDWQATGSGMLLYNCADTVITNNTFYGNDHNGIVLMGGNDRNGGQTRDCVITNNIFAGNGTAGIYFWTWGDRETFNRSHIIDHNLYDAPGKEKHVITWQNPGHIGLTLAEFQAETGYDSHSQMADPRFIDAKHDDFRLKADSPAVDKGVDTPAHLDLHRNLRKQGAGVDLGALERVVDKKKGGVLLFEDFEDGRHEGGTEASGGSHVKIVDDRTLPGSLKALEFLDTPEATPSYQPLAYWSIAPAPTSLLRIAFDVTRLSGSGNSHFYLDLFKGWSQRRARIRFTGDRVEVDTGKTKMAIASGLQNRHWYRIEILFDTTGTAKAFTVRVSDTISGEVLGYHRSCPTFGQQATGPVTLLRFFDDGAESDRILIDHLLAEAVPVLLDEDYDDGQHSGHADSGGGSAVCEIADTPALGQKSMQIIDAPDTRKPYFPLLYYHIPAIDGPDYCVSFDLRRESGTGNNRFYLDLARGFSSTGRRARIQYGDNAIYGAGIGGPADAVAASGLKNGTWYHIQVRGSTSGRSPFYELAVFDRDGHMLGITRQAGYWHGAAGGSIDLLRFFDDGVDFDEFYLDNLRVITFRPR